MVELEMVAGLGNFVDLMVELHLLSLHVLWQCLVIGGMQGSFLKEITYVSMLHDHIRDNRMCLKKKLTIYCGVDHLMRQS